MCNLTPIIEWRVCIKLCHAITNYFNNWASLYHKIKKITKPSIEFGISSKIGPINDKKSLKLNQEKVIELNLQKLTNFLLRRIKIWNLFNSWQVFLVMCWFLFGILYNRRKILNWPVATSPRAQAILMQIIIHAIYLI